VRLAVLACVLALGAASSVARADVIPDPDDVRRPEVLAEDPPARLPEPRSFVLGWLAGLGFAGAAVGAAVVGRRDPGTPARGKKRKLRWATR